MVGQSYVKIDIVNAASFSTISTLGYALLGLLATGEQSGYDLAQGLKDPVSFFWHARHSQIYPELARLETAALVEHTVVSQRDRPDKKVYRLTPAGHTALHVWLTAPTEVPKTRDELVLKAYSMWRADPVAAANLLAEHAHAHRTRLAEYERRLACLTHDHGAAMTRPDSPWFGVHAVLRRGIGYEREYVAWCEWLAHSLGADEG